MFFEKYSALCSKVGKSPNKVAKELSISSGSVTEWKKGRVPQNATVSKIAKYFDVSVDYLFGRTDEKVPVPSEAQDGEKKNLIRIIGRDGSYEERYLTDEQLQAMKAVVKQMPKVEDDF